MCGADVTVVGKEGTVPKIMQTKIMPTKIMPKIMLVFSDAIPPAS